VPLRAAAQHRQTQLQQLAALHLRPRQYVLPRAPGLHGAAAAVARQGLGPAACSSSPERAPGDRGRHGRGGGHGAAYRGAQRGAEGVALAARPGPRSQGPGGEAAVRGRLGPVGGQDAQAGKQVRRQGLLLQLGPEVTSGAHLLRYA
jgi:hypothetical protein